MQRILNSKRFWLLGFFLLFSAIAGLLIYQLSAERFERAARASAQDRISLYSASLNAALSRLDHLPTTVALHPYAVQTLEGVHRSESFSLYLRRVAEAANGAFLYVMDRNGDVVSSSNFDQPNSFVGKNYSFRPYFIAALEGASGTHYAVGATTGVPGYFISKPILKNHEPFGVAVVKVEFADLLRDWKQAGERVLVTDQFGVIIMASEDEWQFKSLLPLDKKAREQLKASKKFLSQDIEPLSFTSSNGVFEGAIGMEGSDYFVSTTSAEQDGWSVYYLTNRSLVTYPALLAGWSVFLFSLLGISFVMLWRLRFQQRQMTLQAREAERIRAANRRLEKEVKIRLEAEDALRRTQSRLVQTNRLAALGKMSAAIVHEVNQPVAAIRTFAASGELLLQKKKTGDVKGVLTKIRLMTERLADITSDLLIFSRRTGKGLGEVDINACIETIADEIELEFQKMDIELKLNLGHDLPLVVGNSVRCEQLIANMVRNGLQSIEMASRKEGKIMISTYLIDDKVEIVIADNGGGISDDALAHMFEPFFTTKQIGEGVGLGLAICFAIVDEAGGGIEAQNNEHYGATFVVSLPAVEAVEQTTQNQLPTARAWVRED